MIYGVLDKMTNLLIKRPNCGLTGEITGRCYHTVGVRSDLQRSRCVRMILNSRYTAALRNELFFKLYIRNVI